MIYWWCRGLTRSCARRHWQQRQPLPGNWSHPSPVMRYVLIRLSLTSMHDDFIEHWSSYLQ